MKSQTHFPWARFISWRVLVVTCAVYGLAGEPVASRHTQAVILVMVDGVRWQEVFKGADPELLKARNTDADVVEKASVAQERYGRTTCEERRRALMPFLWSVMARQGQIFGNRELRSESQVTNGLNFSYPGYAETLTGFVDPKVDSNANVPNPNPTVFQWLDSRPNFHGKVAAFGAWDVFDGIFDKAWCGFTVCAGFAPVEGAACTPTQVVLNTLKAQAPRFWLHEVEDALMFHAAYAYLETARPSVFFVGLGESDEWAHSDSYPDYLDAIHRADSYLEMLWNRAQALDAYRGRTTLLVMPDHGRGAGALWTDHGKDIPEARETWMAFLGPDTPALGERKDAGTVTANQVASTLAALLGEDYVKACPKASGPILEVLRGH